MPDVFFLPWQDTRAGRTYAVRGRLACRGFASHAWCAPAAAELKVKSNRFRPRNGKKWIKGTGKSAPACRLAPSQCKAVGISCLLRIQTSLLPHMTAMGEASAWGSLDMWPRG